MAKNTDGKPASGRAAPRRVRITKTLVDQLRPQLWAYRVWDSGLKGFGVYVQPSGVASYMLKFRTAAGRQRWQTLGRVGILAPDEARAKAHAMLVAVDKGEDPGARQMTVRKLADAFLADIEEKRKPTTAANYRIVLTTHVLPRLGDCRADKVSAGDVAGLHRKIGKNHRAQANAMLRIVSAMFAYAGQPAHHIVPKGFNPAKGLERFREPPRKRPLNGNELARLGAVLRQAETVGLPYAVDDTKPTAKHAPKADKRRVVMSPHVTAALRLLMFTGCRKREILDLRWKDVDVEHGVLNLTKHKTENTIGPKQVPLNPPALAILTSIPKISEFVIASADPKKPRYDLKKSWASVCKAAKLDDLHIHDLRHLHGSTAGNAGFTTLIIAKLLGHAQAKTAERYTHLADDPVRQASERVAGDIATALGEAPISSKGGEIVSLPGRPRS